MARPTKFNKQIAADIIEGVKSGLSREDASRLVGVHVSTLYQWIKDKPDFAQQIEEADSFAVQIATSSLLKAVQSGNYKAALAWLQAKRPTEWGQRSRLDLGNAEGKPFTTSKEIDLSNLSAEELSQLLEIAEKTSITNEDNSEPA